MVGLGFLLVGGVVVGGGFGVVVRGVIRGVIRVW